jgi:hypothetical protein
MKKTEYYYKNDSGEKVFLSEHGLKHSYFLSGYHKASETGFLYTCYFGTGGTTLTPVFKGGKNIVRAEYAGKDVHETNFL